MSSLNRVEIIGNLGTDPDIRYLPSGVTVSTISVATSEKWKDKETGEDKERTEWHRVMAFGKLADIIAEYLHKGSKVYIDGKLRTEKYDKDGVTHYATKIMANRMIMLGGKRDNNAPRNENRPASHPVGQEPPQDDFDDDMPF